MITVFLTFLFDNHSLIDGQQNDRVLQSILTPFRQPRFWQLISFSPLPPAAEITLQMRAIHCPCDEKSEWFVSIHRSTVIPNQPPRSAAPISRHALASGHFSTRPFYINSMTSFQRIRSSVTRQRLVHLSYGVFRISLNGRPAASGQLSKQINSHAAVAGARVFQ